MQLTGESITGRQGQKTIEQGEVLIRELGILSCAEEGKCLSKTKVRAGKSTKF
jgi:hypothetical protein